jgi:DNA-binding LacI/PurR family transcriptional regulator
MAKRHRLTIKDVAEAVGVSTQTVSRVINNRPDVLPETRQRIKEAMERMGYHPNALARGLSQRHSYTLGVVTAGLKYIGPSRTLNGITDQAEQEGYTLLLKELPRFDTDQIIPILNSLYARQVDGIIWVVPEIGDNRAWFQDSQLLPAVPMMLLSKSPHSGVSSVFIDNYQGGRLATEHLLNQGYRHIGHLSGPLDWLDARLRKAGWQDALQAAGKESKEEHSVEGNWSSSSGEVAIQRLLEQYPEMDAVFVANDQMALSVLYIASKMNLRVPQDLGVTGFDNLPESAFFSPPLSSIEQDLHKLGCISVKELVRMVEKIRLENTNPEPISIVFTPELVVRESSSGPHR